MQPDSSLVACMRGRSYNTRRNIPTAQRRAKGSFGERFGDSESAREVGDADEKEERQSTNVRNQIAFLFPPCNPSEAKMAPSITTDAYIYHTDDYVGVECRWIADSMYQRGRRKRKEIGELQKGDPFIYIQHRESENMDRPLQ